MIPALERLHQEDCDLETSWWYLVSPGQSELCSETLSQQTNKTTSSLYHLVFVPFTHFLFLQT